MLMKLSSDAVARKTPSAEKRRHRTGPLGAVRVTVRAPQRTQAAAVS